MKDLIENTSNPEKPRKFFVEGMTNPGSQVWGVRSERSSFEEAKKDLYEMLDEPKQQSHGEDLRIVDEEGKVLWPKPKEEKS